MKHKEEQKQKTKLSRQGKEEEEKRAYPRESDWAKIYGEEESDKIEWIFYF